MNSQGVAFGRNNGFDKRRGFHCDHRVRLQISAPELTDLSNKLQSILDLCGIEDHREPSYACNCLLARRLLERGTRFVQPFHEGWDSATN